MTQQSFNIGKDHTMVLLVNGAFLGTATLTNFEFKREEIDLKSRPVNGRVIHRIIPDGYSGSFEIDRADATVDNYFSNEDDAYYAGLNPAVIYIQQTYRELDGSISQYRFDGVVLKFDSGGSHKQDASIQQKVGFMAVSRRRA